ncbi:MAG TPA: hypothetical protein VMS21_05550 [Methylomirabilota bacterium]|nr:hypothetical protein [Methylomirabilota bacterium]
MKTKMTLTTSCARRLAVPVATLMLGLAIAFSASAQGAGSAKGGATKLMRGSSVTSAESVETAMSCPTCKNERFERKVVSSKGAGHKIVQGTRHLCKDCVTTKNTVGHGKAKRMVTTHECCA